jgi:UDP-N-acetylmuramate dehydrogenase
MINLKSYNTFGIQAFAKAIVAIESEAQLIDFLNTNQEKIFILGGGSNLLLTQNIEAVVLYNQIKGKAILVESEEEVIVKVGGGEIWHEFVLWAIEQGYGGVENLSLIPGTVGASPIQNIGAYGVELKDVFHSLEAVCLTTSTIQTFDKTACQFAYRDSIFKRDSKNKYFITAVTFQLSKQPKLNINYGDIRQILQAKGIETPTIKDVSNAVIEIRQSKLPNPAEIGNSGSFFKNPEILQADFERFIAQNPSAPYYSLGNGYVKIPAGWLIEQAGWKGKRIGDAGCHAKQALVLVNYGNASGSEILGLSKAIQQDVFEKYGIALQAEVNVI